MIEFKALVMKIETDNIPMIFLLKKNVRSNIIKTILGYPPMTTPTSLKKWKIAITSVRQGYKSIKGRQDYKIKLRIIYRGRELLIFIGKAKDNYNKDEKPRCFN